MLSNQPFFLSADSSCACLLLHGLGGGAYEMQLLGEAVHQQGITVQCILYPGHDTPAKTMPHSTWQQWYAHIVETYQSLTQKYSQVAVVGFSTGATLALHLAAGHPLHKLVLLSPYLLIRRCWYYLLPPEAYLFSIGRWIDSIPRRQLPIRDPAIQVAALQASFFQTFNLAAVRSATELIEQVKREVPGIQVPTLIIQSDQDSVVDPSGAAWLYQHLGSASKQIHWLTQSDHVIPLDVERTQVFAEVARFLS
ncbi:MAG: alpha/beta fold hydrolase [Aphanocapsa sp. GSE-SYN-MK-11-07L]|jgi:carboxylesterase|nr:alpha/beta fold hydrolase [Aphanocapsa sp. GSE-SYN-MK-11-07L]